VVGDTGYSSCKVRYYLRRHGMEATLSKQAYEQPQRIFDRELCHERNRVEHGCAAPHDTHQGASRAGLALCVSMLVCAHESSRRRW
jgi:hypothetical protein